MSQQLTTWQKATALVPLALLSTAWTASLVGSGTATAATKDGSRLPDGTTIPSEAIKAPASVSVPGEIAPGVPAGAADSVIASSSTSGIPSAALAAYQRAAQVIDAADSSCNASWPLIAAIGRVESDHGRYGSNTLGQDGVSRPGVFGIPLDGSNGTARITDTDAGRYDGDPVYDRAVGPMQFIPSTWSVVGVDGDGDGMRNPQDIDDAALATAVYLCSGDEDLSTPAGQQVAVYRYNHSQEYVDLVLAIMRAYAQGEYAAVPNGTAAPTTFTPDYGTITSFPAGKHGPRQHQHGDRASAGGSKAGGSTGGASGASGGTTGGTTGGSTPDLPGTDGGGSDDPVKKVTDGATKATDPVVDTISSGTEAVSFCTAQLSGITSDSTAINRCAEKIVGLTNTKAAALIPNTASGVATWLGMSLTELLGGLTGGVGLS
jgi:hypothetical protein